MSLISKFNTEHIKSISKLEEYIEFCISHSQSRERKGRTSNHHILPKTDYPQFKDFKTNEWNKCILTHKDHYIAHSLLAEALNTRAAIFAWWGMNNKDSKSGKISKSEELIGADVYDRLMIEAKKKSSEMGKLNSTFYKSAEFNSGMIVTKDQYGNIHRVTTDDPRYLSGEFKHHTTNTITVRDKDGNSFRVDDNDERYLSGELVGINKGRDIHDENSRKKISNTLKEKQVNVGEKNGNFGKFWITSPEWKHKQVSEEMFKGLEKEGWTRGRNYQTVKCPHCSVMGKGQAMTRYHFDNCKFKT